MPRFRADIAVFFDAPDLESCGGRLAELFTAAGRAGFDVFVGEVSDDVTDDPRYDDGPTAYGPARE